MSPIRSSFGGLSYRGYAPSSGVSLPVVTGGTLTSDATYYYREFRTVGGSSLVIAGGNISVDLLLLLLLLFVVCCHVECDLFDFDGCVGLWFFLWDLCLF